MNLISSRKVRNYPSSFYILTLLRENEISECANAFWLRYLFQDEAKETIGVWLMSRCRSQDLKIANESGDDAKVEERCSRVYLWSLASLIKLDRHRKILFKQKPTQARRRHWCENCPIKFYIGRYTRHTIPMKKKKKEKRKGKFLILYFLLPPQRELSLHFVLVSSSRFCSSLTATNPLRRKVVFKMYANIDAFDHAPFHCFVQ